MGHVKRGGADRALHLLDLKPHLDAQLRIEIGQWLVEQEDGRIAHERAAHGDTLALATGKRARLAVEIGFELQHGGCLIDPLADFVLRLAGDFQPVGHVVEDGHMRIERIVLEHHRDVALARLQIVDHPPADFHRAGGDALKPGHHAQKRGLAAAGRADNDDEFAIGHIQTDAMDDLGLAVGFANVAYGNRRHADFGPSISLSRQGL